MSLLQRLSQVRSLTEISTGLRSSGQEFCLDLENRVQDFASQGLRRRDRVLIKHGNSISFFRDLFSLWKLDACAVPLDPTTPPEEVLRLARHCEAKFILLGPDQALSPLGFESAASTPGHLILYTSGSAGKPKGVIHDLISIENRLRSLEQNLPLEDFAKTLCLLPNSFGHSLIGNSLFPLLTGCDFYIAPPFNITNLRHLAAVIDSHEITFFSSVPSLWRLLRNLPRPQKNTLRRVHCASASFLEDLFEIIRAWTPNSTKIFNVYGTTELAAWVTGYEINSAADAGCVGRGWDTQFDIKDPDTKGVGEVWIQSEGLTLGYLNEPDLTSERIQNGWIRSGDLGFWNEKTGLWLCGRKDDLINRGGLKIYPDEVEAILLKNSNVAAACVFGLSHEILGEIVAAGIVFHDEKNLDLPGLEDWCRQFLPSYRVPSKWFVLSQLPINSRGKVNRTEMKKICLETEDSP